jgi:hypothetical protein
LRCLAQSPVAGVPATRGSKQLAAARGRYSAGQSYTHFTSSCARFECLRFVFRTSGLRLSSVDVRDVAVRPAGRCRLARRRMHKPTKRNILDFLAHFPAEPLKCGSRQGRVLARGTLQVVLTGGQGAMLALCCMHTCITSYACTICMQMFFGYVACRMSVPYLPLRSTSPLGCLWITVTQATAVSLLDDTFDTSDLNKRVCSIMIAT